jgi:hypothetical protein
MEPTTDLPLHVQVGNHGDHRRHRRHRQLQRLRCHHGPSIIWSPSSSSRLSLSSSLSSGSASLSSSSSSPSLASLYRPVPVWLRTLQSDLCKPQSLRVQCDHHQNRFPSPPSPSSDTRRCLDDGDNPGPAGSHWDRVPPVTIILFKAIYAKSSHSVCNAIIIRRASSLGGASITVTIPPLSLPPQMPPQTPGGDWITVTIRDLLERPLQSVPLGSNPPVTIIPIQSLNPPFDRPHLIGTDGRLSYAAPSHFECILNGDRREEREIWPWHIGPSGHSPSGWYVLRALYTDLSEGTD